MVLNVNTNLDIAGQANVFATKTTGIVEDSELTNVAKQILSAAPAKINLGQTSFTRSNSVNNLDVKLYAAGYDVNAVKQAATNQTGFEVNLSQNALSAINSLKAQAAQLQSANLSKAVDGKIHINSEKPDTAALKPTTMFNSSTDVEVFQSTNTNKDRKGPGGFYMPLEKNEEQKEEGLNLII